MAPHAGAKALAEGLQQCKNLDLTRNSIGAVGAMALAEGLQQCKNLDLTRNSIGGALLMWVISYGATCWCQGPC